MMKLEFDKKIIQMKEQSEKKFKEFLEQKSLYTKINFTLYASLKDFKFLPLQLTCPFCTGERTYVFSKDYNEKYSAPKRKAITSIDETVQGKSVHQTAVEAINSAEKGNTHHFVYECQSCNKHRYHFLVSFDFDKIFKSGQEPNQSIRIEKEIEKKLGSELAKHYKNGKVCEQFGLGIAAMAYYRRVVEDKIYSLLDEVGLFVEETKKDEYLQVIKKVKESHSFDVKAELLKDVIPPILISSGINHVKLLFSKISEGLHLKTDEECLESAHDISVLLELIIQIINTQSNSKKSLDEISKRLQK